MVPLLLWLLEEHLPLSVAEDMNRGVGVVVVGGGVVVGVDVGEE